MAVPYKLLKTGGKLPHNKDLRAVIDEYETVGLRQMGVHIERATAMTIADLVGMVEALKYEMVMQLKCGNCVHLPGLGYFSLSVKGEVYQDPRSHKFRLLNPQVRTVRFRPEKQLLTQLSDTQFENRTNLCEPHTTPTDKEIDAALDQLFASSSFIVVDDLPSALHICRSVAYRIARRLEAEGKLRNVGSPRRKIFVRGEG